MRCGCVSLLAQQPSRGHRDGGELAPALYRKGCGGRDADEGPWGLHGGRRQEPAPECQEEHHQHRCSRFDPPASRGCAGGQLIPYQYFEVPGPAGIARATTGSGPESARFGAGGIDLPACRAVWVD